MPMSILKTTTATPNSKSNSYSNNTIATTSKKTTKTSTLLPGLVRCCRSCGGEIVHDNVHRLLAQKRVQVQAALSWDVDHCPLLEAYRIAKKIKIIARCAIVRGVGRLDD